MNKKRINTLELLTTHAIRFTLVLRRRYYLKQINKVHIFHGFNLIQVNLNMKFSNSLLTHIRIFITEKRSKI